MAERTHDEQQLGAVRAVLEAAAGGDCPGVERLVAGCPELLEAANEWGWTPLMQAARGGHRHLVATLISHGADVNAINKLGFSVLGVACASGDERLVQLLQEHGARNHLAAVAAAAHDHPELLGRLLKSDPDHANEFLPISKSTALHLSVAVGSVEGVHTLIGQGANPNLRDAAGRSAFDLAGRLPQSKAANEIINMLQDISSCKLPRSWDDAVLESARGGDLGSLMTLLSEMNLKCVFKKETGHSHSKIFSRALLKAAEHGHALAIEVLLQQEVNINVFSPHGMTPLMLAASNGYYEAAERLVTAGADCKLKNSVSGHTAFELASLSEETPPALARLLAKHTILNADSAPASPRPGRHWPHSPQPPHKLLQLPKSPRPLSLQGSPTLSRSSDQQRSTPNKIKQFFSTISSRIGKQENK